MERLAYGQEAIMSPFYCTVHGAFHGTTAEVEAHLALHTGVCGDDCDMPTLELLADEGCGCVRAALEEPLLPVPCVAIFPIVGLSSAFGKSEKEAGLDAATRFADLIRGWESTEAVHLDGPVVSWIGRARGTREEYLADLRETVGYHGSSQSATAMLNGRPCRPGY